MDLQRGYVIREVPISASLTIVLWKGTTSDPGRHALRHNVDIDLLCPEGWDRRAVVGRSCIAHGEHRPAHAGGVVDGPREGIAMHEQRCRTGEAELNYNGPTKSTRNHIQAHRGVRPMSLSPSRGT